MTAVQQSRRKGDGLALESKVYPNRNGPFSDLRSGPSESLLHRKPVGGKLRHLDVPSRSGAVNAKRRVPSMRCTPCVNPRDDDDQPRYSTHDFSEYARANMSRDSCPFHATEDGVHRSIDVEGLEVDQIMDHQFVRGSGDSITVLFQT